MRASAMGDFTDAIEPDDDHIYDICPVCGDLKLPESALCGECSARKQAEARAAKRDAEELDAKLRRHRLIKAGLMPNRALGETVAPIVHQWWTTPPQSKT